jgi:hypothetical protein
MGRTHQKELAGMRSAPQTTGRRALRKRTHGICLIEVMIAVFVIATGFVGVSGMFLFAIQSSRYADCRMTAAQRAEEALGEIRAAKFADLNNEVFPAQEWFTPLEDPNGLPHGEVEIQFAPYPDETSDSMRLCTVTVSWYADEKDSGDVELSTVIVKPADAEA